MESSDRQEIERRLAQAVRDACLRAALEAHEDAGVRGLCQEGRWEAAVGAIQSMDLERLLADLR
jgi:pentatricopeptide repeat protein